jgi:hypothetical protein
MAEYEQEGRPGQFSDWATDKMAKKFTVPFSAGTRYFQTIPWAEPFLVGTKYFQTIP